MFRNIIAVIILISIIAMSSSGMIMFFNDDKESKDLVEAVHLTFGFFLTFGALCHLVLNFTPLARHFKKKSSVVVGIVLSALLAFLYIAPNM